MGKVKKEATANPKAQAGKLLKRRLVLELKLQEARTQAGIPAIEEKLDKVKAALVTAMVDGGLDQVEAMGFHATLVKQNYGSMFLATSEDVESAQRDLEFPEDRVLRSVRSILRDKYGAMTKGSKSLEIWKRITRPVVVPELVEEVIADKLLTVDEIADAFVEKTKKPYARVFKD